MDIEKLATSAVEDSISLTEVLSPSINKEDKEPSWDGSIFIYKDSSKTKTDIKRVPVQVKGMRRKEFMPKHNVKYSVSRVDLDNWLNHGGIVLFVVFIDDSGTRKEIYYNSLLPVKIRCLKKNAHGKKKLTVPLKKFPVDNDQKVALMLDFFDNMQKQASFANVPLCSIDELEKQGVLEQISFSVTSYGAPKTDYELESLLFQNDVYMYANIKGAAAPQPLLEMPQDIHISKRVEGTVQINDQIFFRDYRIIRSAAGSDICFGKSLMLKINEDEKNANLTFNIGGTLSDYIQDTECLVAILENRKLLINGREFTFHDVDDVSIERHKRNLAYFRDIKKMLDLLGVKQELTFDGLTEQDEITIRNFTDAIVNDKTVGFPGYKEDTVVASFKIGNLVILIWACKVSEGKYKMQNFFGRHGLVMFELDDTEKKHPFHISHYALLNKENFLQAANMDYEMILDDISSNDTSPIVTERLTLFVLEMLKAYDEQVNKDHELLSTAEQYCDWLIENDADNNDMLTLNRLQIIRRKREFLPEEISTLQSMRKSNPDLAVKCGANLLLGRTESAQDCFDEMDNEQKSIFMEYPICHFGLLKDEE